MFKWFGKVNFSPYTKVSDFAQHLKDGYLMASRCKKCGATSFPPRADCGECMSGDFEFFEISGDATLHTFTKIVAAPTGFEDVTPYTVGVVDLAETGRLLASSLRNSPIRLCRRVLVRTLRICGVTSSRVCDICALRAS